MIDILGCLRAAVNNSSSTILNNSVVRLIFGPCIVTLLIVIIIYLCGGHVTLSAILVIAGIIKVYQLCIHRITPQKCQIPQTISQTSLESLRQSLTDNPVVQQSVATIEQLDNMQLSQFIKLK